ncbi:hypothetical protein N3K66_001165 [Trichothecium roseum]|uniref:Uncharacterized protein n=1 Tax=Trichothecium roseum TaxID=47278 RepID=A0ACC0VDX9_9HYPO|nr:hypothetical protein N3K66_001165 [Trichothecium roseum]
MFSRKKDKEKRGPRYGLTEAFLDLPLYPGAGKVELPKGRKVTVKTYPDDEEESRVYTLTSSSSSGISSSNSSSLESSDSRCMKNKKKASPTKKSGWKQEKSKARHQRRGAYDDGHPEGTKSSATRRPNKEKKLARDRRSSYHISGQDKGPEAQQGYYPTLKSSISYPPVGLPNQSSFGSATSYNSAPVPMIWPSSTILPSQQPLVGGYQVYPPASFHAVPCFPPQTAVMSAHDSAMQLPMAKAYTNKPPSRQSLPSGTAPTIEEQIQRVQNEIDRKGLELAANPGDTSSDFYLKLLREKLSELLDKATTHRSGTRPTASPLDTTFVPSDAAKDGTASIPAEKKTKADKDYSNNKKPLPDILKTRESTSSHSKPEAKSRNHKRTEKARSFVHTKTHHLCSGCGNVRSIKFHDKHPIGTGPGQHRIGNYCESCRDTLISKNVVKGRHFCFGCGKVRSRMFHEDHPALEGDCLLPNYCSSCTAEMQSDEEMDDASVVRMSTQKSSHKKANRTVNASEAAEESSKMEESVTTPLVRPAYEEHVVRSPENRATKTAAHPSQSPNEPSLRYSNQASSHRMQPPNPVPAKASPYLPQRNTGSSKRRARRSPLTLHAEPARMHYQPPYVEETDYEAYEHAKDPGGATYHTDGLNGKPYQKPFTSFSRPKETYMYSPGAPPSRMHVNERGYNRASPDSYTQRSPYESSRLAHNGNGGFTPNHGPSSNSPNQGLHANSQYNDYGSHGNLRTSTGAQPNQGSHYATSVDALNDRRGYCDKGPQGYSTIPFSPTFSNAHNAHQTPSPSSAFGRNRQNSSNSGEQKFSPEASKQ